MCAHHLVDPVACTPASGWEKGQVENQVGLVRERFFKLSRLPACRNWNAIPRWLECMDERWQTNSFEVK
jgi:IS30 family transposase